LALGGAGILFCFFPLADVISALVVIRILLQFLLQAIGLIVLRIRRPEMPRPFRMWLYPAPAILAILGFLYVVVKRHDSLKEVRYAAVILIVGLIIYMLRAWRNRDWPFGQPVAAPAEVQAS
jgi:amino acid transporter